MMYCKERYIENVPLCGYPNYANFTNAVLEKVHEVGADT